MIISNFIRTRSLLCDITVEKKIGIIFSRTGYKE